MELVTRTFGEWKYGTKTSSEVLHEIAVENNLKVTDKSFQEYLDGEDKLAKFRDQFIIPQMKNYIKAGTPSGECVHLCGNSLGLQPKATKELVNKVLDNWGNNTVESHERGFLPAAWCDLCVTEDMGQMVGAYKDEVAVMNGLTVNLHLLLISFYLPTNTRNKILIEHMAFPSDHYAVESQIKQRGLNPEECMLFAKPREGEEIWRMEDVLDLIEKEGESIALILLPSVHYYTGQVFDMEAITKAGHLKGCRVGFDLAHAVGNIEINLHDWDVDFACWCNYKYMNSSPGAIAGAFLHRKFKEHDFPKLIGWWGHKPDTKFQMTNKLEICEGISGYRISNPPPLLVAPLKASLDIFKQTSMREIREKSFLLTGYLELLLQHYFPNNGTNKTYVEIITPAQFHQRGCQLSIKFSVPVRKVLEELEKNGVISDIREPNVLRIAPIPLYNSYHDVYKFVCIVREVLGKC